MVSPAGAVSNQSRPVRKRHPEQKHKIKPHGHDQAEPSLPAVWASPPRPCTEELP
jgi:hypothetical protein